MKIKKVFGLVLIAAMLLSLAAPCFAAGAEGEEPFDSLSGVLFSGASSFPEEYRDDPEDQGMGGEPNVRYITQAYSAPLKAAAQEFECVTGIQINFILLNAPEFGGTAEEDIDIYIQNGVISGGRVASNQILMLCTLDDPEVAFRAGDGVYDVITEEELEDAADVIASADDELLNQRVLRGLKQLFIYALDGGDIEYLPYSRAGEYLRHRDTGINTELFSVSLFNDEDISGAMTKKSIEEAQSIKYLLDSIHAYSGIAVYMTDSLDAAGGASTAEEAAEFNLAVSHDDERTAGKLMCASEYNGLAVIYNTATGEGAIVAEDDVKNVLTDEDITNILAAFKGGRENEYDNVLAGTKQLIKCVFDGGEFEYPADSIIADVMNERGGAGADVIPIALIGGAFVIVVAVTAFVIVKNKKKRKNG